MLSGRLAARSNRLARGGRRDRFCRRGGDSAGRLSARNARESCQRRRQLIAGAARDVRALSLACLCRETEPFRRFSLRQLPPASCSAVSRARVSISDFGCPVPFDGAWESGARGQFRNAESLRRYRWQKSGGLLPTPGFCHQSPAGG